MTSAGVFTLGANVKRLMTVVVLTLAGCTPEPQLKTEPAVTAKGDPTGSPTQGVIGAAGGTLTSGDGKLKLTVPAGALSADTTLTMTPLSVTAPGGLQAFRLGPEGTTFSSPASLSFTASDADLAGTDLSGLRIAYQDEQGRWLSFNDATVDGHTVTIKTTHLSDWSINTGFLLRPPSAKVKLGGTLALSVRYCNVVAVDGLMSIAAACQEDEDILPLLGAWAVNGTTGGSSAVGTVGAVVGTNKATYTAPSSKPSSNPVAVSVEMYTKNRASKTLLVSNVTVGDDFPAGYTGTFTFRERYGGPGTSVAFQDTTANGTVTMTPWPEQGPNRYHITGQLTVTAFEVELGACRCTSSGGAGTLADNSSLTLRDDGTVRFGWATTVNVGLTCNMGGCPSTHPLGLTFSVATVNPACTGTLQNPATNPSHLTGSFREECSTSNSLLNVGWDFTATN